MMVVLFFCFVFQNTFNFNSLKENSPHIIEWTSTVGVVNVSAFLCNSCCNFTLYGLGD